MWPVLILTTLLSWTSAFASEDFKVPDSWRKPVIESRIDERISLAKAALDRAMPNAGSPGLLFGEMAEYDIVMKQTIYHELLLQLYDGANKILPGWKEDHQHGYAAIRAYRAYNDSTFFSIARSLWEYGRDYTLTQAQVDAGKTPVKNFDIQTNCSSLTMAGGTFWHRNASQDYIVGLSTGQYLVLSALLAESSPGNNTEYMDAAMNAARFIHNHLYNVLGIVQDGISAKAGEGRCNTALDTFPHNSGLFIEGLGILADLKAADLNGRSIVELLEQSIKAATSFESWQGSNGIVSSDVGKSMYTRALLAIYRRQTTNIALRKYIKAFMGVQYNAVLDNAAVPGADVYSGSWIGPPPTDVATTFHVDYQAKAINVLIGSIILYNEEENHGSTPKVSLGAIIGAAVGGCLLLIFCLGALLFRRRRRSKKKLEDSLDAKKSLDILHDLEPEPFIYEPGASNARIKSPTGPRYSFELISPSDGIEFKEKPGTSRGPVSIDGSSSSIYEKGRSRSGSNAEKPYSTGRPMSSSTTDIVYGSTSADSRVQGTIFSPTNARRPVSIRTEPLITSPRSAVMRPEPIGTPTAPSDPNIPTEELVRMLNQRLQQSGQQWDPEEDPPNYNG